MQQDDLQAGGLDLKDPSLLQDACLIGGQWVGAETGETFPVHNPASGARLGTVPNMGATETRQAIEAAQAALAGWRAAPAKERSAILRRWNDLILEHKDDLAALMTAEQGKPLAESKGEIMYGAALVEWFAEEAKRIYGDTIPSPFPRPASSCSGSRWGSVPPSRPGTSRSPWSPAKRLRPWRRAARSS
jgi:NAD-dependent aldehyde dehydrogenases